MSLALERVGVARLSVVVGAGTDRCWLPRRCLGGTGCVFELRATTLRCESERVRVCALFGLQLYGSEDLYLSFLDTWTC